jgi:hypothetical protein
MSRSRLHRWWPSRRSQARTCTRACPVYSKCGTWEWFTSAETDLVDSSSVVRLLDEHVSPASDLWMQATLVAR